MKLSDAKSAAVFKVRVEVGDRLGLARPEDAYVVLREPTLGEVTALSAESAKANSDLMFQCIVEHNIEADGGGLASAKDVADMIRSSSTLAGYIAGVWQEALPLPKKSAGS